MSSYNKHPALAAIQAKLFQYPADIMPYQFMDYYYSLPVLTPSMQTMNVRTTRYVSNVAEPGITERRNWRAKVRKHYDKVGWPPSLENWFKSGRDGAVFNGHGLPEEISLVCLLAQVADYRTGTDVETWAHDSIGIDCNGFVNAYLTAAGYFTRPLHDHEAMINVSPPAKTVSEISWDSVIVTARTLSGGPIPKPPPPPSEILYKVKKNPGGTYDKGAHILVVDCWEEYGKTFWASDQPGTNYPGPQCLIYEIVKAPPDSANQKLNYVWTIRKQYSGEAGDRLVYITRQMQTH